MDMKERIPELADLVVTTSPLVQNITNLVVQNDTADAIAAVGGTQVTLHTLEEARPIADICSALALNLGTLDENLLRSARIAVETMNGRGRPWVLDPVAAGLTAYRGDAALEFLGLGPAVLKANASEVLAIASEGPRGHGADSVDPVEAAADAAGELARRHRCVVVVTGAEDLVTDGVRTATVRNGHPMMGRMIGAGCMLTSVMGCFLAVGDDPFESAVAAAACFGVAGELAAERSAGPGTLKPQLIDALHNLETGTLQSRLRVA